MIAGIAVRLPFCSFPLCAPVLFRLWAGKGSASPVKLAGELVTQLVAQFGDRQVRGVGDAAHRGQSLLVAAGATWTTRLPLNAALFAQAPPEIGRSFVRKPPCCCCSRDSSSRLASWLWLPTRIR